MSYVFVVFVICWQCGIIIVLICTKNHGLEGRIDSRNTENWHFFLWNIESKIYFFHFFVRYLNVSLWKLIVSLPSGWWKSYAARNFHKAGLCCILTFDLAKHAIPKWCTGRKWHIPMAVMGRNRVGGLGWQYGTR